MHHIILPAPVTIGGKAWHFRATVEWIVDNDPEFLRPASRARMAARLLESLDAALRAKDSAWTIAQDDDLKLLRDASERWKTGITYTYQSADGKPQTREIPLRLLLSHIDAIAEARVKDPRAELHTEPAPAAEAAEASAN